MMLSLKVLVVVLLLTTLYSLKLNSLLRRHAGIALTIVSIGQFNQCEIANAITDCKTDCVKNCVLQAPGSKDYCLVSCSDYCDQDDRHDGLSGSLDAVNGETGNP